MKHLTHRLLAPAFLTGLLAACGGGGDESPPAPLSALSTAGAEATAQAPAGPLVGTATETTVVFRGIPYALPPGADRRWQPPVPAPAWTAPLDAAAFRPHCPQENAPADPAASEDCLYLNVYVPKSVVGEQSGQPRPVMVWLYGGANAYGASDWYDPTALVETGDVIVVTPNYRVGALGFLSHPALDAEGHDAVNYGVMDQRLALQWVRDNIASFGGDAGNVTIFGESAGGLNVTAHLVSPGSAGLFHKAIIESGGYLLETPTLAAAQAKGTAFAARLGCGDAACLRGKTVAEILANQGVVNTDSAAYYQMAQDGAVVREQLATALAAGRFHRVPVMVGSNSGEGHLFFASSLNAAGYQSTVDFYSVKNHRAPADTVATYPLAGYPSPFEAASAVLGDAEFNCPARRTSQWLSNWVATYAYEFSDPASLLNSAHFAEIYYLFDYKGVAGMGLRGGPDSQALSLAMRRYWTQFAKTGNPNAADVPVWAAYRPATDNLQLLAPPAPREDAARSDADFASRHRCGYWG